MSHTLLAQRSSGLLLHPTSLPSPHGIGDLGPEARAFVEFLAQSRQTWWQMLPVTPPTVESPYGSSSAFAGNPLLIDLRALVRDGFLSASELPHDRSSGPVDFAFAYAEKMRRLEMAFSKKASVLKRRAALAQDLEAFEHKEKSWLSDYALFAALHRAHDDRPWTDWDADLRDRTRAGLTRAKASLAQQIERERFVQWLFHRQWQALRQHASHHGVRLMGDLPIFVALDSADVWAHRELFLLGATGQPKAVAGVPPDYFSEEGQLWGNPLYDWAAMKKVRYRWWVDRFAALLERFDAVRIDHFIGFYRAWHVPRGALTAKEGAWRPGPRAALFKRLREKLGDLPIVAEDLGAVTKEIWALRDQFGFPGMRVLQFAFGEPGSKNEHQPHLYPENSVVYTGTHDNPPVAGWLHQLNKAIAAGGADGKVAKAQRDHLHQYLGRAHESVPWALIRLAMLSAANTTIFPVQDILGLGLEARMNVPGVAAGNWAFRLEPGVLTHELAEQLATITTVYGRAPNHAAVGAGAAG